MAERKRNRPETTPLFTSSEPYKSQRIGAAALYCSDGRLGDHIDEFLHQGLGLPRYDRLTCPGGPVALADRMFALWDTRGVEEQLRFLVTAHSLEQVVLLGHQDCAYYRVRIGLAGDEAAAAQRQDLKRAATLIQHMSPAIVVSAYFVELSGERVQFVAVELPPR